MKNAIILHGLGSNPREFWFPWLKKELEKKGYRVWVPQLPDNDNADLAIQLPYILNKGIFNKGTVIIGHSSGAALILAILDTIHVKVNKAILVAGFLLRGGQRPVKAVKDEDKYNWGKIKTKVSKIFFINSDNDPWGCDHTQGKRMFDHLGGTQIILHNEGHMGSVYFKQPYKKFPLLLALIK